MPHSYQLPDSTHHSIYTATSHCVSVCGHTLYGGLLVTTSPIYNMKLLNGLCSGVDREVLWVLKHPFMPEAIGLVYCTVHQVTSSLKIQRTRSTLFISGFRYIYYDW